LLFFPNPRKTKETLFELMDFFEVCEKWDAQLRHMVLPEPSAKRRIHFKNQLDFHFGWREHALQRR